MVSVTQQGKGKPGLGPGPVPATSSGCWGASTPQSSPSCAVEGSADTFRRLGKLWRMMQGWDHGAVLLPHPLDGFEIIDALRASPEVPTPQAWNSAVPPQPVSLWVRPSSSRGLRQGLLFSPQGWNGGTSGGLSRQMAYFGGASWLREPWVLSSFASWRTSLGKELQSCSVKVLKC